MYVIVWEYEVRVDAAAAFERLYGADGGWAALFRRHPGYLGTELLHDAQASQRYLTLDRWRTQAEYETCLAAARADYAALDAEGDALTLREQCLGRFRAPD